MKRHLFAAAFATAAFAPSAFAQGFMSTDRLSYYGSVSRYGSQADAIARQNAMYTSADLQRDFSLYFVNNNAAYNSPGNPSEAYAASGWYFTNGNNDPNPNNTSIGFFQLADRSGATLTSQTEQWLNPGRTTFGFMASGGNTVAGCPNGDPPVPAGDCGRLWNGSETPVLHPEQYGSFYEYEMSFVAYGLTAATWNSDFGVWYSQSDPTEIDGYFRGVFQNTSDTESNGWYSFDYTLNLDNYVTANGFDVYMSEFAAAEESATPEPASVALVATGLLGLAAIRRKRRA